jgi:hypothetical protein
VLRSSELHIMGFRYFLAPAQVRHDAYRQLTEHAARRDISVDVIPVALDEAADAWAQQHRGASAKLVLIPKP